VAGLGSHLHGLDPFRLKLLLYLGPDLAGLEVEILFHHHHGNLRPRQ
jgi:hypothetical protein